MSPPVAPLADLLAALATVPEMRALATRLPDGDHLERHLPETGSRASFALALVSLVVRHGALAALVAVLMDAYPGRRREIALLGTQPTTAPPTPKIRALGWADHAALNAALCLAFPDEAAEGRLRTALAAAGLPAPKLEPGERARWLPVLTAAQLQAPAGAAAVVLVALSLLPEHPALLAFVERAS